MIQVEPFHSELHLPEMCQLLAEHKLPQTLANELPSIGLVARCGNLLVGMIFLRQIEGCQTAMVDGLITNPKAEPSIRNLAVDQLISSLIGKAKSIGLHQLVADSIDPNTLERTLRHGFVHLPHTLMSLGLFQKESE